MPEVRSSKTFYVWPEQLRERKANNRFDYGNIDELGKSVLSKGILQPLLVRKSKDKTEDDYPIFDVIVGNRRAKAAKRIRDKWMESHDGEGDFVPIHIIGDDWSEEDIIIASVITDSQGKERNMLEIAYDVQALIASGMKQGKIANSIGKSAMYVSDCMTLIEKATPEIIKQIKDGQITPYTALEMLKSTDAALVEEAVTKASKKQAEEPVGKGGKKKPLKKTQIEEAHGAPMTEKGKKKAASYGKEQNLAQAGKDKTDKKDDATLSSLKQLKETLKANAGPKKASNFGILNAIIKYAEGKADALDMLSLFFWGEDTEDDAKYEEQTQKPETEAPPAAKKPAAKAPAAKETKKAAPAKSGKGVQTLKDKKKAAAKHEDEEDLELEDVPGDEDDDFDLE